MRAVLLWLAVLACAWSTEPGKLTIRFQITDVHVKAIDKAYVIDDHGRFEFRDLSAKDSGITTVVSGLIEPSGDRYRVIAHRLSFKGEVVLRSDWYDRVIAVQGRPEDNPVIGAVAMGSVTLFHVLLE